MTTRVELDLEKICDQAQKNNETEALLENLFSLTLLAQKNYEIRSLLTHKQLSTEEKITLLKDVPGFKSSSVFNTVVSLILETNNFKSLQTIFDRISNIINEKQNCIVVHIETAVPLSSEFSEKISAQFSEIFKKQIILKAFVNQNLVAGIVVTLPGGSVYDYSYKRLLSDFKHYVRERN